MFKKYCYLLKILNEISSKCMYHLINKRRLSKKLEGIDKLNIGCGNTLLKGWLNIGLFPRSFHYGSTKLQEGALVLHFDMIEELPIPEDSIKYLYASHFIEHLKFQDGIKVLERCYKTMKKGGIIRLTFPDMELWIKNYYEDNLEFFEKYKNIFLGGNNSIAKTKGEIFMSQVHNWGHKWNYDFESIKHILEKIGFSQVTKKKVFESLIPNINDIELKGEGRLIETCYVEAIK